METDKHITILNEQKYIDIKVLIKNTGVYYIDTSFINILRKYIISNIETCTFYYINKENKNPNIKPIKINTNNINNLNNDMLGHRISLLPINIYALEILVLFSHYKKSKIYDLKQIEEFEITQEDLYDNELKFYIKKSYEDFEFEYGTNFISITDEHIKNDLFDILTLTSDKNTEELKIRDDFIEYIFENEEYNSIINILNDKYDYNITDREELKLLKLFKPYIYNDKTYYNIITKIKINQQIDINMYLMKNSVVSDSYTENNIRYSPVAACRSTFVINYIEVLDIFNNKNLKFNDQEYELIKQKIIDLNGINKLLNNNDLDNLKIDGIDLSGFKRFCIEEAERYYYGKNNQNYRKHILEYESLNFYKPKVILKKALKNLIDKNITTYNNINILDNIHKNINLDDILIKNIPLSLNKYKISKSDKLTPHLNNAIDILIYDGNHGLGYLIQTYINYIDKNTNNIITYIGYKMIHPLENKLLISIQIKEGEEGEDGENYKILKDIFIKTYDYLNVFIEHLLKELK
jgi:DNA-directed RNA polymerase subunit L